MGRWIIGGEGVGRLAVGDGTVFTGEDNFGAAAVGRGIAGAGGDGVDRGKEGGDLDSGNDVVKGRTVVCICWCAPRRLLWSERGWSSGPAVALLSTSPSYVGESTPSSASPSTSDVVAACLCPGLIFAGVVVEVLVFLARVPVGG